MKIVYIILAYKLPAMLNRLVDRIEDGSSLILIHVDRKTDDATYQAMTQRLGGRPKVHFLRERFVCNWADFGRVAASLAALRKFVSDGGVDDRIVLLSGQDYPLKPPIDVKAYFDVRPEISFIDNFPMPKPGWQIDGGMYLLERGRAASGLSAWEIIRQLGSLIEADQSDSSPRRRLPLRLVPFCGSSWWALTYDCASYVVQFVDEHPEIVEFFDNVVVPDEMFFQTILLNSPFRDKILSDDLHLIEWSEGGIRTFNASDFGRLVMSNKLFARKFDLHHNIEILDLLDEYLDQDAWAPDAANLDNRDLVQELQVDIAFLRKVLVNHNIARVEAQAEHIGRLKSEVQHLRAEIERLHEAWGQRIGSEKSPNKAATTSQHPLQKKRKK